MATRMRFQSRPGRYRAGQRLREVPLRGWLAAFVFSLLFPWVFALYGPIFLLVWLVCGLVLWSALNVEPSVRDLAALVIGLALGWASITEVQHLKCSGPHCYTGS